MSVVKFEQAPANQQEQNLMDDINTLLKAVNMGDCRTLANPIRTICNLNKCEMEVGCGGSHIWIHRKSEFVHGENSNAKNIRWAIITDN